jgi:aminomethyltransferase
MTATAAAQTAETLPLNDIHVAAGAKFGDFAGWSMPLSYPLGVMKEHLHTREHAGLFDISHMKLIAVSGPRSADLLNRTCPLDVAALATGQSKYTFFLDDSAGIIDDLIVTRLGETRFMVVANAGNAAVDIAHLQNAASAFDATVEPLDRVFLALQGPEAAAVLDQAGLETDRLGFMTGFEPRPGWFMSRSGYTGEDGFEIGLPAAEARPLVEKLLADSRVAWIGLAARDSLRLEAGLCLHGNEISPKTTPASAGLLWAIPKTIRETGSFIGADALRAAIASGPAEKRVGLKPLGRQPVRGGAALFDAEGNRVGTVTSGGFGPSAGHPVAMGYVATALVKPDTDLFADVRGTKVPVQVHALPFTPHRYRKG